MIVTSVTKIDSRRQKVILDNEYVFSLYNSEIKKYNIVVDLILSEEFITNIENEILYPRAKERALYMLGRGDKTRKQLEDKLKEGSYPDNIVDKVVGFLISYGYIDDERFTLTYINNKMRSKSKRQIKSELLKKGISMSLINECFKEEDYESQLTAIKNIINKPKYKSMIYDSINVNKVIVSLLRRGFEYEQITRCINEMKEF